MLASEENDQPIWISDDGPYVVVTDPLDGSRKIEVSIPTGTIFGIYNRLMELDHLPLEERAQLNSLQSGTRLVAAGYVLYSSATILCISFGAGTHAFTLDWSTGEFILTHPSLQIPPRGTQLYQYSEICFFPNSSLSIDQLWPLLQVVSKLISELSTRIVCEDATEKFYWFK